MTTKESMETYRKLQSLELKSGEGNINIASLIPDNVQEEIKLAILVRTFNRLSLQQLENLEDHLLRTPNTFKLC